MYQCWYFCILTDSRNPYRIGRSYRVSFNNKAELKVIQFSFSIPPNDSLIIIKWVRCTLSQILYFLNWSFYYSIHFADNNFVYWLTLIACIQPWLVWPTGDKSECRSFAGLALYFLYGVWHSKERQTSQYGEIVGYTGDANISCSTISKMGEEIIEQQPKRAEGEQVHIGAGAEFSWPFKKIQS